MKSLRPVELDQAECLVACRSTHPDNVGGGDFNERASRPPDLELGRIGRTRRKTRDHLIPVVILRCGFLYPSAHDLSSFFTPFCLSKLPSKRSRHVGVFSHNAKQNFVMIRDGQATSNLGRSTNPDCRCQHPARPCQRLRDNRQKTAPRRG